MGKVVPAYPFNREDRAAFILSQQQRRCVQRDLFLIEDLRPARGLREGAI